MNSQLYDKQYKIPVNIIGYIKNALVKYPSGEGVRRAKYMVKNGSVTYQGMKRIKNYFDEYSRNGGDEVQYMLAGGKLMKDFIETTLTADRNAVSTSNNVRRDIHNNPNSELKPFKSKVRLYESKNKIRNVVGIIVNNDNKILLVRRSDKSEWMPNLWSFVGGGVDRDETAIRAVRREIIEEVGLDINDFINSFTIQRNGDDNIVEYIYVCRYDGNDTDVILNSENVSYGWFGINEITYLNTVPHIAEYLTLTFKKYE